MDNQQGTLTNELAWLGGILDGEGCFAIYYRSDTGGYAGRISIRNTSKTMIDECARILEANGLPRHIRNIGLPPSAARNRVVGKRPMWDLHIDGIRRVGRALDTLLPYIVAKKDQAILLNDFCKYRLSISRFAGYGAKDKWYFDRIKKVRDSSETMSVAEIYSEDIVQTAARAVEAAEMTARQNEIVLVTK